MSTPILSVKNVSYQPNESTILKDISFNVEKGEKVILTGPSGSGKSTLLKVIGSILSPSNGTVYYSDTSIEDIEPTDYRKEVSYFFQNAQLFDQTVRDNLSFPYSIREEAFSEEKVVDYLKQVELPESYLDKPIKELSGGEKQRVALIRNLLFEPEVLLLDEVTSSLDAKNQRIIQEMIDRLNTEKGRTILIITHDQNEIKQADRVIQIRDGRMEETT